MSDKEENHYSINLAIVGGVIGAGIGLLAGPEFKKKIMKSIQDSELANTAVKDLITIIQQTFTEQAVHSMIQTKKKYLESSEKEDEVSKNLNERMDRIESMLNDLVDSRES